MADHYPWQLLDHIPWHHFTSPRHQWDVLPTFLVGESMFLTFAVAALAHAWRRGSGHLLIWFAAVIAGTANDLIFMALPLVDNFWQAQATIMLTPRLPLYIPCVYVCFLYYPTVAARRLGMNAWATAALAGLLGILFYAPYDIVGAKFLWWTWHDTDQPIATRILGAPTSSSLWVVTFTGSFAWLIGRVLRDGVELPARAFLRGFALVAGLTTALMMVQMSLLQQLGGGVPGYASLAAGLLFYAAVVWAGKRAAKPAENAPDGFARTVIVAHYATLVFLMAAFSPETHSSTGLHQMPGACGVEARDITGLVRHEFLCVDNFDEDYTFDCTTAPEAGRAWYTVCGRPHRNFAAWLGGVLALGVMGIGVFSRVFGATGPQ
jgi:hypothetical protein